MDVALETLHEAENAARRVIAARVRNPADREELVQETLTRLVRASSRLDGDALVPYAIVTARNLTISEHRLRSRRSSVWDIDTTSGADDEIVRLAEAGALQRALAHLSPADRQLIVARDVDDTPIDELAERYECTPGALRTRLTRLRGRLRLEYVLAFRHIDPLPTPACRSTLEALTASDAVKTRGVAEAHLASCATCRDLEPAVRGRRRALAAIAPFALLAGAIRFVRTRPVLSTAVAGTAAAGVAVVLTVGDPPPRPPATVRPQRTVTVTTAQVDVNNEAWSPAVAGPQAGQPVAARHVSVTAVPADERFVVSTDTGQLITVHLVGGGESPVAVRTGQYVSLLGQVSSRPSEDGAALSVDVPFAGVTIE